MRGRLTILAACALLAGAPAFSHDVCNTYIALGTQIANGVIDLTTKVTGILPAANGGAGTINGALKANGSGTVSQAACANLSDGATGCSTAYTEPSWTPTLIGSTTAGTGQTYSTQVGSYERVGRQVTLRFNVAATSLGTAAGNLLLGGLPVATANVTSDWGACVITFYTVTGLAALNYGITGAILPNTSQVLLEQNGSTGSQGVTIAQAGNTPTIAGTCTYRAS